MARWRLVSDGAVFIKKRQGTWPKAAVKAIQDSIGAIPWRGAELVLDSISEAKAAINGPDA